MTPRLYFTCPAEWRGTEIEVNTQLLLMIEFPEHQISGPHKKNRELTIRRSHPAFSVPNRFYDSARTSADICVALRYPDGKMPSDVFDDMSWFLEKGIPVFVVEPGGGLHRYEGVPHYKQVLTLEETQQRLQEKEMIADG